MSHMSGSIQRERNSSSRSRMLLASCGWSQQVFYCGDAFPQAAPRGTEMRPGSKPRNARRLILPFVLGILVVLQLSVSETALAGGTHGQHPQLAPDMAQKMSEIDRYIDGERKATGLPGLAIAIVQGNAIVHMRGYGIADKQSRRPVTLATPFVLASSSKSFTALAIMQLVEAGKINLDSPVVQYIPWFRMADNEASSHITVRQLLIQTSGLSGKSEIAPCS